MQSAGRAGRRPRQSRLRGSQKQRICVHVAALPTAVPSGCGHPSPASLIHPHTLSLALVQLDDICTICHEELSGIDVARLLSQADGPPWCWACSHIYCAPCLLKSLAKPPCVGKCPVCRTSSSATHIRFMHSGHNGIRVTSIAEIISSTLAQDSAAVAARRLAEADGAAASPDDWSGLDEYVGGLGDDEDDDLGDAEEDLRMRRAVAGRLAGRETRRRNATARVAAQTSAAETVATDVAALSAALQEDVASAMVASALREVGCAVRRGTTLEANGLSDFELAATVARRTELPLPQRSWAFLGEVVRTNERVLLAMQGL